MKTLEQYLGHSVGPELKRQAMDYLMKNSKWANNSKLENDQMVYSESFLNEFFSSTNPRYSAVQELITEYTT